MPFNNTFFPSDLNGTGQWRAIMPIQTCWCLGPQTDITNTVLQNIVIEEHYFKDQNMFMVQRLVNSEQKKYFTAICEYSKIFGFWTVYNIDDAMHYEDIPKFNRGRKAFCSKETQENIKDMLNMADFVLVTTSYLKNYYHKKYDVPLENIIAIPNLLPRWWIGSFFDADKSVENFRRTQKRPRIGVVSSLSHYNIDDLVETDDGKVVFRKKDEEGKFYFENDDGEKVTDLSTCKRVKDEFDILHDLILKTVDEVQWVFFGYMPPKLEEYIKQGKIEYHSGIPITNYPQKLSNLKLTAIVAPLYDNEFNRCKSNIKYLEACAVGVPLYAQNVSCYSKYMPENQLFSSPDDLYEKLMKLKKTSATVYRDIIERQYRWLNSPTTDGDFPLHNWFLEDNLGIWMKLFSMRKKHQVISLDRYLKVMEEKNRKKTIILENPDEDIQILK